MDPGHIVSRYRLVEKIGKGGMGEVFCAEDLALGRQVAIKFLNSFSDDRIRSRFLREARAISQLNHPNIATLYDYGESDDGCPYIVMELVRGRTLVELLNNTQLTLPVALEIIGQVAQALHEAHRHNIIHRDIKPSNIIVSDETRVKVLDFGLAKQVKADEEFRLAATVTQSGTILGTPLYLSPEQALGERLDIRSDLFSLGALLYELLTGRPPFMGKNVIEIGSRIINDDPKPPSEFNPSVPAELDRVVVKSLAKRPEERYQSASDFLSDLRISAGLVSEKDRTIIGTVNDLYEAHQARSATASNLLLSISDSLARPRVSIAFLLLSLIAATLLLLLYYNFSNRPHTPSAAARTLFDAGIRALQNGEYFRATKELEGAVRTDPEYIQARIRLADAWMERDYYERARNEIQSAKNIASNRRVSEIDQLYLDSFSSAILNGDYERATSTHQKLLSIAKTDPLIHMDMGRFYEKSEQLDKASESYRTAIGLDQRLAAAHLRLGTLLGRRDEIEEAERSLIKAEQLFERSGNREGKAETLYQRGTLLTQRGRSQEGLQFFLQAQSMAEVPSNNYLKIKSMLQSSTVYLQMGDYNRATEYTRLAVDLSIADSMEELPARGLIDLGNIYFTKGDYQEAEKHYRSALQIAQRYRGLRNQFRALISLGSLRIQQGDTTIGWRYVEQALAFYQRAGYRKEASQALILLGRTNRKQGNYEAAIRAFKQQLQFALQTGDELQIALSRNDLGGALADLDRFREALSEFEAAQNSAEHSRNELIKAFCLINTANVLWRLGYYDESQKRLETAVTIADRHEQIGAELIAWCHLNMAAIQISQLRYLQAANILESINTRNYTNRELLAERLYLLGTVLYRTKRPEEAIKRFDEANHLIRQENRWLTSQLQFSKTEALMELGDQRAQDEFTKALELFERDKRRESLWRLYVTGSKLSEQKRDEADQYRQRARTLLKDLEAEWGSSHFRSYLSRPDIQRYSHPLS